MASLRGTCTLCSDFIIDRNFEPINDYIKNILNVLLLKLKFEDENVYLICGNCNEKLNAAFKFKSKCLNINAKILPYTKSKKTLQVNLRDIYVKENGNIELADISDEQQICGLCMQLIKSDYIRVHGNEVDAIHKFIPEMNISIVKNPVICKLCYDSLCVHNNFLEKCLQIDERIRKIYEISTTDNQVDVPSLDPLIETQNLVIKSEINDEEMLIENEYYDIKLEEIQIKTEDNEGESNCTDDLRDKCLLESTSEEKKQFQQGNPMYKCSKCNFETQTKILLEIHRSKHKEIVQVRMYKCDECDYKTERRSLLVSHKFNHKGPSNVPMYKCNVCKFETRYEKHLKKHELVHKIASKVQMYKCDLCDYKSRHERLLISHQLVHKNATEKQIYICCDKCNHGPHSKRHLVFHKVNHRDS